MLRADTSYLWLLPNVKESKLSWGGNNLPIGKTYQQRRVCKILRVRYRGRKYTGMRELQ